MVRASITSNIDQIIADVGQVPKSVIQKIKAEVIRSGNNVKSGAKRRAPVDTGLLKASIKLRIVDKGFTALVGSELEHAPFVEFGTRAGVDIPSGLGEIAREFRVGTNKFPPVAPIERWASRHGLGGLGFIIAQNIQTNGTPAQPYLFPAFEQEAPRFERRIQQILRGI